MNPPVPDLISQARTGKYINDSLHGTTIGTVYCSAVDDDTVQGNLNMILSTALYPCYWTIYKVCIITADDQETSTSDANVLRSAQRQRVNRRGYLRLLVGFLNPGLTNCVSLWDTNPKNPDTIIRQGLKVLTSLGKKSLLH